MVATPYDTTPAYLKVLNLKRADGHITEVDFFTSGFDSQEEVLNLLRNKFGKPTQFRSSDVQTKIGAKLKKISAQWKLKDAELVFEGMLEHTDVGQVTLTSSSAIAAAAKLEKPTLVP